ncbi:MAG: hypothetical protein JWO95_525 [Verrucomicrobiales bacterium]|nr:hypothetical protein [Verrucomicrobiales bacterium]
MRKCDRECIDVLTAPVFRSMFNVGLRSGRSAWTFDVRLFRKTKSSHPVLRPNRSKLGDGSTPLSLSRTDVRHLASEVTGFPTPFSTASGVYFGLIAGPLISVARIKFE